VADAVPFWCATRDAVAVVGLRLVRAAQRRPERVTHTSGKLDVVAFDVCRRYDAPRDTWVGRRRRWRNLRMREPKTRLLP
jgi:hypothetical protein